MNIIKSLFITGILVLGLTMSAQAGPKVVISTSEGDITLELNEEKAPKTVANFLSYVKDGFFDSTVFHRVIKGFMIQGGGFALEESGEIKQKPTKAPVENEAKNGLKNARGTIAMARTSDPHSATAQFFINHGNNSNLDYPSFDGWGYAVFGNVTEGMDVVEKIANTSTGMKTLTTKGGKAPMKDVPEKNIVIKSIKVTD
jgi:cyclophilin family peptidyl-prolyl cis-trans isomerase